MTTVFLCTRIMKAATYFFCLKDVVWALFMITGGSNPMSLIVCLIGKLDLVSVRKSMSAVWL